MSLSRFIRTTILLLALINSVSAQDLEQAWQQYLRTSDRLSNMQDRHHTYLDEQEQLNMEVVEIKRSSSWYNAWLNKLLLSGYAQRQLELADSIRTLESDLLNLSMTQKENQGQLKRAYESILHAVEDVTTLTDQQQSTTLRVGRWINALPNSKVSLPDYQHLVDDKYASTEIRQIILTDVRALITTKLIQLDSLLLDRSREAELEGRLAAFHEDLGLRMDVEQDAQPRDDSGTPLQTNAWGNRSPTASYEALDAFGGDERLTISEKINESLPLNGRRSTFQATVSGISAKSETDYLNAKKDEYIKLLSIIEQELNDFR